MMADLMHQGAFGVLTEPTTLVVQRVLPGPVERIWRYLTDSEMRRKWLASGDMVLQPGAPFTLTWRNDELTDPPGVRPEGFGAEHSMACEVTEVDAPRRLAFAWPGVGHVTFELVAQGSEVLLTLTHRRLPDRGTMLSVSSGWHAHLDVLVAVTTGAKAAPYWDSWVSLKQAYAERIPA